MSWTTPRTWSAGDAVTADVLNAGSHADVMAPVEPPAPLSIKAVAVGVAAALVADPTPLDRRGFFTPWRRK